MNGHRPRGITRRYVTTVAGAALIAPFALREVFVRTGSGSAPGRSDEDRTPLAPATTHDRLRNEPVLRPEMFGPTTDPVTTTATLLAALTHAMATRRPLELSGRYTITGPITPEAEVDGAELHLRLAGDVTVTVEDRAEPFLRVIYAEGVTATSHSITGEGSLTIDCNNRAAVGLWLRHRAPRDGGTVALDSPVRVYNARGATDHDTVGGIIILGRFERIVLRSPEVVEVTRAKAAAECGGIVVSGFAGDVEIHSPTVRRVRTGAGDGDADGIKCFGQPTRGGSNHRRGSVRIYDPVFADCQGRSYKDQCGDTVIYRPRVSRDARVLTSIRSGLDFDFQAGGGLVIDPIIEYRRHGSISPLGPSFSVVAFQQVINDASTSGAIRNATIRSDVVLPRYALHITRADALASTTEVDGLILIPTNGLAGAMLDRAVLEFDGGEVAAKDAETTLRVRNVRGPIASPIIGYTGYFAGDLTNRLNLTVQSCFTTLPEEGRRARAFGSLSGRSITSVRALELGEGPGEIVASDARPRRQRETPKP